MIRWLNVRQPEPERYFKSDFLERFTFFRLSTVWLIWLPIILLSLFGSFYSAGKISTEAAGGHFFLLVLGVLFWLVLGVLRWTLMEYFLHRFPFHYDGGSEFWRKISVHTWHSSQASYVEYAPGHAAAFQSECGRARRSARLVADGFDL